jgi:hypothetical protein
MLLLTRCAHVCDPHVTLQISILEALTLFGVEAVIFFMYINLKFHLLLFFQSQQGDDPNSGCFHSREGDFVTVRPHPAFELRRTGF